MGKFMHCTVFGINVGSGDSQKCSYNHPNDHLISTSFWAGFPGAEFWANAKYPNVDFADIHQYISKSESSSLFYDTALATFNHSAEYGKNSNVKKPVIRGETGFTNSGTEPGTSDFLKDADAVWLHNFIWGQINSGGLMESYWYSSYDNYGHLYASSFDHRNQFKSYYQFIKNIPLNNNRYTDAEAVKTNSNLRVWGQKDTVNNRVHLWIANAQHTWKNVVDNAAIAPISDTVKIGGFAPNTALKTLR